MLNETVYEWLEKKGYADRITEHTETIDTVEHAVQQIGCSETAMKRFAYIHQLEAMNLYPLS